MESFLSIYLPLVITVTFFRRLTNLDMIPYMFKAIPHLNIVPLFAIFLKLAYCNSLLFICFPYKNIYIHFLS